GKYLIYAHKAGERTVKLPHEMLRVFKTVKAYEQYLEQLWHEFRNAYGRQCGSPYTARRLADEVFERLGLPAIVVKPPVPERDSHPDNTARRVARGARTPPVAFYLPLLQVLNELGGAGRANQVAELVGRKMQASLNDVDFKPLPSSGVPRWRNTVCWARDSMVRNGLLKSDSRKGIWEISQEGRDYLERYRR
ncbi:MAG: winged helix-turn-helix domain-containing protein, partial [Candidatus Brocadiia bacterium]